MKIEIKNQLRTYKDISSGILCVYRNYIGYAQEFNMHLNGMLEIYCFVEGEADYIVESRCYSLEPYDIMILNPYEPHTPILKKDGMPYERFYFHIPVDAFSFMDNDPMDIILRENIKGNNRISLPPEKKEKLKALLEVFKTNWSPRDRVSSFSGYSSLLGILTLLNEHISELSSSGMSGVAAYESADDMPPIIFDVLRYIEKNISSGFSESELAENFHISAPYLSRLFKSHIKMGLKKYILLHRVGHAKKLLSNDMSVTDTCFACGFNDCSYFIKVFKTYTGMTPYKYQLTSKSGKKMDI